MIFSFMDNNKNMDNEEQSTKHSDFSIDHILNRAGNGIVKNSEEPVFCERTLSENVEKFEWLQCSRYCPPKVPRIHKKDVQKRQLGRHPRIPFTSHQLSILEHKFRESPYLSSEEVILLSKKLQLADIRVKIWFQNRRARERREKNSVFGENKMPEEKKDVLENPFRRNNSSSVTDASNLCPRDTDNDNGIVMRTSQSQSSLTCVIKPEGRCRVPLDCSKATDLVLTNDEGDIIKSAAVSSPYIFSNSVLNQNMSLFIPFVNLSRSNGNNIS